MEDKELNVSSTFPSRLAAVETSPMPNSLRDAISKLTMRTLALEASQAAHKMRLMELARESAVVRDLLERLQTELTDIQDMRHQLIGEREDSLATLNATFNSIKTKLDEAVRAHKGKDDENEILAIKTKLEQCRAEIYAHERDTAGHLADFKASMDQKHNKVRDLHETLEKLEMQEDAVRKQLEQIEKELEMVQNHLAQVQSMMKRDAARKMRQNSPSQVASLPGNYYLRKDSGKEGDRCSLVKQVVVSSSPSCGANVADTKAHRERSEMQDLLRRMEAMYEAMMVDMQEKRAELSRCDDEMQHVQSALKELLMRKCLVDDSVEETYTRLTTLEGERTLVKEAGEAELALIDKELREIAKIIKELKHDKYKNKEELDKLIERQQECAETKAKRAHELQCELSKFDTEIAHVRHQKEQIKHEREQLSRRISELTLVVDDRRSTHEALLRACADLDRQLAETQMRIHQRREELNSSSSSAFPTSDLPRHVHLLDSRSLDDRYLVEIKNTLVSSSNSMRDEEKSWNAAEIELANTIHLPSQWLESTPSSPALCIYNPTSGPASPKEHVEGSTVPAAANTLAEGAKSKEKSPKSKKSKSKEDDEWYFPPWRYVQQMKVPPAPVFQEDAKALPADDDDEPAAAEERGGPRRREISEEDDEEVMGVHRTTIEDLRESGFLFQQGDIVCVGLSHNIKGFFRHANNTLLALVAYVSCPRKDENGIGLQWRDGVCHAGFISYGGTVDTAEMAHNRSHGLESWSLLKYLELSTMPIWVIRSPMLTIAPDQPHRVYTYVERSIFEAMLDRYALHSAWMKSYLSPAEADKYNFSFLLSFFSLYSDALRREIEKNPSLGSNPGEFCAVWRHVMPFGELINFPPLHSLLGGEGAYCSLSVAQFFHDCLSVHCDVDPAVRQTPSLSPFFLGLEKPINDLVKGMKLRINDGLHFKILSPYTLEILRRLAYLEGDLSCNGALAKMAGIGTVVDVTVDWDMRMARSKRKDKRSTRANGSGMQDHRSPSSSASPILRHKVTSPARLHATRGDPLPLEHITAACNFTADPSPSHRVDTSLVDEDVYYAWPSQEELQFLSESQLWDLISTKHSQLREIIRQKVTVAGVVRFQPRQIDAIMAPVTDLTTKMRTYVEDYARDRSVNRAELLRGCMDEFMRVADSCAEKAHCVNKLSAHVFTSLELLLTKTRNAILNEWVADLHMRTPKNSNLVVHDDNQNGLFDDPRGVSGNESRRYGANEEEKRLWEEEMLRLCVRYHAESKVKHNLDFLMFLVDHRERTVPFISGDGGLQTSTTLARTRAMIGALHSVVGERLRLLQKEIEMVVRSRKDKIIPSTDVDGLFVTLPEDLEATIIRQATCPTASRDSVLAEYLNVSESSGLVVIDAAEAHLDRTESVFRPSTCSPRDRDSASGASSPRTMGSSSSPGSPTSIFSGKGPLPSAPDTANSNTKLYPTASANDPHTLSLRVDENATEMSKGGSFRSPKSPLTRSRETYGEMFNHQAFLVHKQHLEAKDHYEDMYRGTLRMLPAERLAIERRNRVQRTNELADTTGAKVVMHVLFFYLLAVGYAYYHSYQSCFTAPFTFLSLIPAHLPAFLWSSATVLSLMFCLTVVFFQPAMHFAVILALVWERIVWTSFLRAFALAAATIGLQMSHNVTVLCSTLRRVEWVAMAGVLLLVWTLVYGAPTSTLTIDTVNTDTASAIAEAATAVRGAVSPTPIAVLPTSSTAEFAPTFLATTLSFVLWLLHITCWALALATHYLPISSTMIFDHLCLALPLAYLFTIHLPLAVPTVEYLSAHTLCVIAFIICFISAMPRTKKKKRHTTTAESGSTTTQFVHSAAYVTIHALSLPKSTRLAKFLLKLFGNLTRGSTSSGTTPRVAHASSTGNTEDAPSATSRGAAAKSAVKILPVARSAPTNARHTSSACRAGKAAETASWALPSLPAWILYALELVFKAWLATSIVPQYFLFFTHTTALMFAAEVVLAMYYDALRCQRHSLIAIFRSIRDLRINLDHDFRQQVVSGTVQPTVEDFNRSIMRGVERYMVLPQWLRDFAKDSAVVYPMPAHQRKDSPPVDHM